VPRPKDVYCQFCGVKMKVEFDRDYDIYIWYCPDCGATHTEGDE